MEAAAEGAPLAETLHYWREGAHCISAWYSIIAPEKAGGNEAAANPRSSQRRGAANRPNGAWVASTPAGWRYPSAMPRELSPPKRFAIGATHAIPSEEQRVRCYRCPVHCCCWTGRLARVSRLGLAATARSPFRTCAR